MVAAGPHAGRSIRELVEQYGAEIGFSADQCDRPFGLLIKFLDADDDLSVQVHPDRKACEILRDARLKSECWAILAAEPDAVIYKGFKPGVGKDQLAAAIQDGTVEQLLEVVPVKVGDFHYLPAGTVHAIGAGIVIAEIQTPSDTTYRIFDWNRTDDQGRSRTLHIEESLLCCHYSDGSTPPFVQEPFALSAGQENLKCLARQLGQAETLLECPFYSVIRGRAVSSVQIPTHEQPAVMIVTGGSGAIGNVSDDADAVSFSAGDTILLPCADAISLQVDEPVECLLTCLGPEKP